MWIRPPSLSRDSKRVTWSKQTWFRRNWLINTFLEIIRIYDPCFQWSDHVNKSNIIMHSSVLPEKKRRGEHEQPQHRPCHRRSLWQTAMISPAAYGVWDNKFLPWKKNSMKIHSLLQTKPILLLCASVCVREREREREKRIEEKQTCTQFGITLGSGFH